jgi:ATP-dependent DNA helicase DinG
MSDAADHAEYLLGRVVEATGGDLRPGQVAMARAVADAFDRREHLLVEAGTGVGKSFGYLVPAVAHGRPVVVATATKGLQDQLGGKDLPTVAAALAEEAPRLTWAVVKGRGSYLCRSRLSEALVEAGWTDQGALFDAVELPGELGRVAAWSQETTTGDRDELPFTVEDWGAYSVGGMECPGRDHCPNGDDCFAYAALDRAADADVVVVNHHLYAAHLGTDGTLLPRHEALVVDEAHRLEDTMAAALGVDLAPWRVFQLTRAMGSLPSLIGADAGRMQRGLAALARDLERAIGQTPPGRFGDLTELPVAGPLEGLAVAVGELAARLRGVKPDQPALSGARARMLRLAGHLVGDVGVLAEPGEGVVTWVEGGDRPSLRAAPVDVAGLLAERLLGEVTMVGTSATLSVGGRLEPMARRLGLDGDVHPVTLERVGSPFDYANQARCYVAAGLPDPRTDAWREAVGDETLRLVVAAGGRALVLCTSRRMVDLVAERLAGAGSHRLLVQGELGAQAITAAFVADETSVLVATMGFWEGLDVPGRALELVVIDRVPFPRPDDPLWAARRDEVERRGGSAFREVDLPRAAMLLAQGAGRLIRSTSDHGVVAILDPRLATAGYRRDLLAALPPMPVTTDRAEVEAFLRG